MEMYVIDDIAYAGEKSPAVQVKSVRPLDNYRLWVRFNTNEVKLFDFSPLLDFPAYAPLKDKAVFNSVYVDYGVPVWNDGEIDIAPEQVYAKGISAESGKSA
jgi:hypothetical protein